MRHLSSSLTGLWIKTQYPCSPGTSPIRASSTSADLFSIGSEVVQEISIQKAPVLECLELGELDVLPIGIKSIVGHLLIKGPLPNLRIFCISHILFPWSLVPRGRLTQLKVTLSNEVSTVTPEDPQHDDLNELIGVLVDSPSLEVLSLEMCLPAMLNESSGEQTIHLPRLSRLSLSGSSSRVTNLLKMLKLPSSTTLRLECTTLRTSKYTATHKDYHILPLLSEHFNGPTPVKFRGVKINHVGHITNLIASTSLPIRHSHVSEADSDVELRLTFYDIAELSNKVDILRRACDMLSFSNIEFLSLHSPSLNRLINWSEIFRQCTEVTTLRIDGPGTINLLQALALPHRIDTADRDCGKGRKRKHGDNTNGGGVQAQAPDDDDNDAPASMHVSPIFPKLTFLGLEMWESSDMVPGSGDLYDLVMSVVQQREANKMPLTTLCVYSCWIREEQAEVLAKVVRNFSWDGCENDSDDDYDWYDEFGG
jgi:hypothetical protein